MSVAAPAGLSLDVLQESLNKALSIVSRFANSKSTLPIAHNILLATDRGRLKVAATDLTTSAEVWVGARIDVEGATTVPAQMFSALIPTLPPATALLTLAEKLTIVCALREATLPTMAAEDYPALPVVEGETIHIPAQMLARALGTVLTSVSHTDSRPALTAVHWAGDTLLCTDGYRASRYRLNLEEVPDWDFLLPGAAAQEVARICEKSTEPVAVTCSPRKVSFGLTDIRITTSLVEGVMPNMAQFFLPPSGSVVTCKKIDLLSALRTIEVYAKTETRDGGAVHLETIAHGLKVWSKGDGSGSGEAVIDGEVTGEGEVAFRPGWLTEVVQSLGENVTFGIRSPSDAVTFVSDDPNAMHVMMPKVGRQ